MRNLIAVAAGPWGRRRLAPVTFRAQTGVSLPFDPLSWGLGFIATRATSSLIERLWGQTLQSRLAAEAAEWAGGLPENISMPAEVVFDAGSESPGAARQRLQAVLYLHSRVPSAKDWLEALLETWNERRAELGESGNAFLRQPEREARRHLNLLAHRLAITCQQEAKLFQVTALRGLQRIAATSEQLREDGMATRSILLAELERLREAIAQPESRGLRHAARALQDPVRVDISALIDLHQSILVDEPAGVVTGRLRRGLVWVGPPESTPDTARYVAPAPEEIVERLVEFTARWDSEVRKFERDPFSAAASFHHGLLSIHPFEDGNGRLARLLLQEQLRVYAAHGRRILIRHDVRYPDALRAADSGDLEQLRRLIHSLTAGQAG